MELAERVERERKEGRGKKIEGERKQGKRMRMTRRKYGGGDKRMEQETRVEKLKSRERNWYKNSKSVRNIEDKTSKHSRREEIKSKQNQTDQKISHRVVWQAKSTDMTGWGRSAAVYFLHLLSAYHHSFPFPHVQPQLLLLFSTSSPDVFTCEPVLYSSASHVHTC